MNNEPVAWMDKDGKIFYTNGIAHTLPLYLHPAKELTDEEILQVMMNVYSDTVPPIRGIEFAKAILKKAQEV